MLRQTIKIALKYFFEKNYLPVPQILFTVSGDVISNKCLDWSSSVEDLHLVFSLNLDSSYVSV